MLQHSSEKQTGTVCTLPERNRPRLVADFITDEHDILQAQRLRYDVFCEEYSVTLPTQAHWQGLPIDADEVDQYCHHLVVRDGNTLELVGYTRILTDEGATQLGRFYSASEFDISSITSLPGRKMEIGRTCIHPEYRNGATIAVLWSRLAQFMMESGYRYLFGCASISLTDGGLGYATLMPGLRTKHLCDPAYRVKPLLPLQITPSSGDLDVPMPPLLKAYMRMGAQICGEACWDPDFNVADLLVLLDIERLANRYARHFIKPVQANVA
jgi:putative hemolysin